MVCGGFLYSPTTVAADPLRVLHSNPRYFTDETGKAIYMTGSHVWNNLQDWSDQPKLDYEGFLDLLQSLNHNFVRMWTWEHASVPGRSLPDDPLPYQRTGPGEDLLGRPKFDVTKFDQAYFERLRVRVKAAQARNMYASVMLFQGWSLEGKGKQPNPWKGHPFNVGNNVNGINGDVDGDGEGKEVHTLEVPAITALQEAYVSKVVDTVNDLDNVLYEISNESHADSQDWQYHMIGFINNYEAGKAKQHPVGMTAEYPGADNSDLTESPADWISPHGSEGQGSHEMNNDYLISPPVADGKKIIISDTDHLWGLGGTPDWVWKSFLRGINPIFMDLDPYQMEKGEYRGKLPNGESVRRAMGLARRFAQRADLASMTPRSEIASSGYCLAHEGKEYLVYLPADHYESLWDKWTSRLLRAVLQRERAKSVSIDLSAASSPVAVEWFNPRTTETIRMGTTTGGVVKTFTAPFPGEAVLYLKG